MPAKVIITKRVEADLRAYIARFDRGEETGGAVPAAMEILARLDKATEVPLGLAPKVFLDSVQRHRRVILPHHGGASREYGQLAKRLRDLAVTEAQADLLGMWLATNTKWQDPTLDSLTRNLPAWLTRAMEQPAHAAPARGKEWDDE